MQIPGPRLAGPGSGSLEKTSGHRTMNVPHGVFCGWKSGKDVPVSSCPLRLIHFKPESCDGYVFHRVRMTLPRDNGGVLQGTDYG
jgi:hypothetical protein